MTNPRYDVTRALLFALVIGIALCGCSKDKVTKPNPPEERLNSDKPNGNPRVVTQSRFGDPAKGSIMWLLMRNASGQYHFRGRSDSRLGVGTLGPSGSLDHFYGTAYSPNDLCGVPTTIAPQPSFLAVGSRDSDGDGLSEVGSAALFSAGCTPLLELPFAADTSDLWLNCMAPLTDSTYLVAGGERRGTTRFPFLATVKLNASQQFVRMASVTFESEPTRVFFGGLTVFPPEAGVTDLLIGAMTAAEGQLQPDRVHGIRISSAALEQVSFEWTHDVVARAGSKTLIRVMRGFGDNLYLAGYTGDDRKQTDTPDNPWPSGVVASYGRDGSERWMTVVSLTAHSETFSSLAVTGNVLAAVGEAAAYLMTADPKEMFGYGLITRLNPATGAVIENLTLGDDRYRSGLSAVSIAGTTIACGGYGEQEVNGGGFRGWFCTVNAGAALGAGRAGGSAGARAAGRSADPARGGGCSGHALRR